VTFPFKCHYLPFRIFVSNPLLIVIVKLTSWYVTFSMLLHNHEVICFLLSYQLRVHLHQQQWSSKSLEAPRQFLTWVVRLKQCQALTKRSMHFIMVMMMFLVVISAILLYCQCTRQKLSGVLAVVTMLKCWQIFQSNQTTHVAVCFGRCHCLHYYSWEWESCEWLRVVWV